MKGASFLRQEEVFEPPSLCALPSDRTSEAPTHCAMKIRYYKAFEGYDLIIGS